MLALIMLVVFVGVLLGVVLLIRSRNLQYWLSSYVRQCATRRREQGGDLNVYVCFADHFEPYGGGSDVERARRKVAQWAERYPELASRHVDSFGGHPKHSFFYPIEEYDASILDQLADLERRGFAGVEVHYHHDHDTAANLAAELRRFSKTLRDRHGLLRADGDVDPAYCFIHGNWALDNSRPDGRWCGVDNELSVLVATGCRADLTMPSAPSDTQTRKINSIYAARGREGKRKSHDTGRDIRVGEWLESDELLMIQGPLALNWSNRKAGIMPKIENGEISSDAPPSEDRVSLWLEFAASVAGAEQHLFVKLHTHGAEDDTMQMLLDSGFEALWQLLERSVRDKPGLKLRYVTAWEMFTTIRDLACTKKGSSHDANQPR